MNFGCLFDESVKLYNDNQREMKTIDSSGKFGSNRHNRVSMGAIREAFRQKLISI